MRTTTKKPKRIARALKNSRKVCLLCGTPVPASVAGRLAHLLKYHAEEECELILESYDGIVAGVPEMERVIKAATQAAEEVLELERMLALPDRRRAKR